MLSRGIQTGDMTRVLSYLLVPRVLRNEHHGAGQGVPGLVHILLLTKHKSSEILAVPQLERSLSNKKLAAINATAQPCHQRMKHGI